MFVPILLGMNRRATLDLPVDLSPEEAVKICAVVSAYVDADRVFRSPLPSWEAYAAAMEGRRQ